MSVEERYERVQEEVEQMCRSCGRAADAVTLIAVSKTVGLREVAEAARGGARDFGENRPDQLVSKAEAYPDYRWHFIGNIQSRRIRDIVGHACLIHSLFEERHAQRISAVAQEMGKMQDVLIEVNVSGEASKSGVTPTEAPELVRAVAALPNVCVRGLMTMAPQGDMEVARQCFFDLTELQSTIKGILDTEDAAVFDQISAGMSEDWPSAIEAGSTMVRVGRAIFSDTF